MQEDTPEVVEPAVVEPVAEPEGKPVGPATIVTDEPMIEQFPEHKADVE